MAQERRNPLPPGRYWITAAGPQKIQAFEAWHTAFSAFVKIEHEQLVPATSSQPTINFYIFSTSTPLSWLARELGFPNLAPPSINTMADTALTPAPAPLFDGLELSGTTLAIIAVAVYFLLKDHK